MRSAVTLWLISAGLVVSALVLVGGNDLPIAIAVGQALVILALLGFATVGLAILRRHRNHPMGWVFGGGATLGVVEFTTTEWALHGPTSGTGTSGFARTAGWVANWIQFPAVFALLVLTLFLFPDGRFMSPRWRRMTICAGAVTLSLTAAVAMAPGPLPHPLEVWTNPFGVE